MADGQSPLSNLILISQSPADTIALGQQWGEALPPGSLVGLDGELGAGKTELVRGLARGLGYRGRVHSPTFNLIHEYWGGRLPLFHLDLYRLASPADWLSAGLDEYLERPDGVTVIEWINRASISGWPPF